MAALSFVLTSLQDAPDLPVLPASKFTVGQEFFWETEHQVKGESIGGTKYDLTERSYYRFKVIGVENDGIRVARWGVFEDVYKTEPDVVDWLSPWRGFYVTQDSHEKAVTIAFQTLKPDFTFASPSALGIKKPGDKIKFSYTSGEVYKYEVEATRVVKIDGVDCLEVVGLWRMPVYFRLSDGLIQSVKEYDVARDSLAPYDTIENGKAVVKYKKVFPNGYYEFKFDGVIVNGTQIYRAKRLDKLPPKTTG